MLLNSGQFLTERAKISGTMEAWVDHAGGERTTFRDSNARANRIAHALLAMGFAPGDRLAALMSNTPLHAESYYAAAKAGHVFVELNWRLTVPELGYQIMDSGASDVLYGGICLMTPAHAKHKVGSTGRPYFGIDVRVVDKAGNDVPPGMPGEVTTRGPHLISGYWNLPDATREAMRDGWFHTGDIAEVDEDGFIYIKNRSKDMVISGGENVYPAEVENVLLSHPGVKEVAVIGQPSARWGESTCAVIVMAGDWKGSSDELTGELKAHVNGRLARYKQPRAYEYIDALPLNPSGKVLKRVLRERFPGPAPE